MTWGHINLHGEYDFTKGANDNEERFGAEEMKAFNVGVQLRNNLEASIKIV